VCGDVGGCGVAVSGGEAAGENSGFELVLLGAYGLQRVYGEQVSEPRGTL
jgi:hypothetical protein